MLWSGGGGGGTGIGDVLAIVGDDYGCGGEGDNHTDESEEAAPDGEGEEDNGGIESHFFAHYVGGDYIIANGLHNDINQERFAEEGEEGDFTAERIDEADKGYGDYGDVLEVGNHVKYSNGYTHWDGKGESDDGEAGAVANHGA